MLSTPIPARPTILSFVPASMMSFVTLTALRTMRPSYAGMAALRSSGFILPLKSTSISAFRRMRAHSSPTSSAMRTFGMLLVHALEILRFARVHPDQLALLDERRHLDDGAGLERRGFIDVRDRRPLERGFRLDDLELHGEGYLDGDGAPLVELDLADRVLLEPLGVLPQQRFVERHLLEGLLIHKDIGLAVLVEIFHVDLLDVDDVELVARPEADLFRVPALQVPHLDLDHRAQVSRRVVIDVHDVLELSLVVDDHPLPDFGAPDVGHGYFLSGSSSTQTLSTCSYFTSSFSSKKMGISRCADSAASDPWIRLNPLDDP